MKTPETYKAVVRDFTCPITLVDIEAVPDLPRSILDVSLIALALERAACFNTRGIFLLAHNDGSILHIPTASSRLGKSAHCDVINDMRNLKRTATSETHIAVVRASKTLPHVRAVAALAI